MWPNPQFPADLVTFIEEILNGKLYIFFSVTYASDFYSFGNVIMNFGEFDFSFIIFIKILPNSSEKEVVKLRNFYFRNSHLDWSDTFSS